MKLPHTWVRLAIVMVGVGFGPLILFLATPLLARIYTPADFGHLALFMSVVSILTVVVSLRYEGAIQVVGDSTVDRITWVCVFTIGLIFIISLIGLLLSSIQSQFESLYNLYKDVVWVPLAAACMGLITVASNWTFRSNQYIKNIALKSGVSILFVLIALGGDVSLLHANVIASMIVGMGAFTYLLFSVKRERILDIFDVAKYHLKYPFLLAPTSVLDAAALTLPILFMSGSYGMDSTGHYSQVQRLIGAPMLLISVTAGQLFTKRSGELYRNGESSRTLLWRTVSYLSLGGLLVVMMIVVFGERVCSFILGNAWRSDIHFLLLTSIPLIVRLVISPISTVFLTHHHIWVAVIWQIIYFGLTYIGLQYAARTMSFERFLLMYCFIEVLAYLCYLALGHFISANRKLEIKKND